MLNDNSKLHQYDMNTMICGDSNEHIVDESCVVQNNRGKSTLNIIPLNSRELRFQMKQEANISEKSLFTVDNNDGIAKKVMNELICPVCLDRFCLPVTIPCGHTFCRYCITHDKLLGKNCPVCRQPIGFNFSTNTILHSIVKLLSLQKSRNLLELNEYDFLKESILVGTERPRWWYLIFCKPTISVTLFGRILADEVLGVGVIFAEDLARCIIDKFSSLILKSENKDISKLIWSNGIYMMGPIETQILTQCIGCSPLPFKDDPDYNNPNSSAIFSLENHSNFKNSIKQWVEQCIAQKPTILQIGQNHFINSTSYPIIRVLSDRIHRIDPKIYDLGLIRTSLPWDLGRHSKSTIQIPHSSVSTNHLLIVNIQDHFKFIKTTFSQQFTSSDYNIEETHNNIYSNYQNKDWNLGIIDLGSSIGTMLKIPLRHQLLSGEVIHLADRIELVINVRKVKEVTLDIKNPHRNNPLIKSEWPKLRWSKKLGLVINIDHYSGDHQVKLDKNSMTYSNNNNIYEHLKSDKIPEYSPMKDHILPLSLQELDLEEIDEYLEIYIPLIASEKPPCDTAVMLENGKYWSVIVHPYGMVFGRGSVGALGLKKVEVTENNGYISREHCIFYYSPQDSTITDQNRARVDFLNRDITKLSKWHVKDISTLGTFLRLKPFSDPLKIHPGMVIKVGQCKLEIIPFIFGNAIPFLSSNISEFVSNIPISPGNQVSNLANGTSNQATPMLSQSISVTPNNLIWPYSDGINSSVILPSLNNSTFPNLNISTISQMNAITAANLVNAATLVSILNSSEIEPESETTVTNSISTPPLNTSSNISLYENLFLQRINSNRISLQQLYNSNLNLDQLRDEEIPSFQQVMINPTLDNDSTTTLGRRPRMPRVIQQGGDLSLEIDNQEQNNFQ
ncbi:FHA domain-containing protein [Cryptosporidium andersoni]|uniref:E3 ubiquitin-protein ligase CHFR n=1 Tax=Cryptosporidium andersoni TaxID=117008 RepID=A0A1J4MW83_9CRYT|nr:FHA domain-containing protein [Cryptosporidium andersoni]